MLVSVYITSYELECGTLDVLSSGRTFSHAKARVLISALVFLHVA